MATPVKHHFVVGEQINHLLVIGAARKENGHRLVPVRCVCGVEKEMRADWLYSARVKSCGCLRSALCRTSATTHGMSRTPEYEAWCDMRSRCTDPSDSEFSNYGGRGIRVCESWGASFEAFFADVGQRPSAVHSLDRINNDGNYQPGNVRWSLPADQARNRRVTVVICRAGVSKPLASWCDEAGLPYRVVWQRLYRYGWPIERALTDAMGSDSRRRVWGLA